MIITQNKNGMQDQYSRVSMPSLLCSMCHLFAVNQSTNSAHCLQAGTKGLFSEKTGDQTTHTLLKST
jgi:hypothetical protein